MIQAAKIIGSWLVTIGFVGIGLVGIALIGAGVVFGVLTLDIGGNTFLLVSIFGYPILTSLILNGILPILSLKIKKK